jgi:hypothetical protein
LTKVERERITDSVLKVQSVRASLNHLDGNKIPDLGEMEECLDDVDHGLRKALGYAKSDSTADV